MATVTNQSVPPSLIDRFAEVYDMRETWPTGTSKTKTRPHYVGWTDYNPNSPRGKLAAMTGTWFRDNWGGIIPLTDLANFAAARKQDIYTGTFPANYWTLIAPNYNCTELCKPGSVLPYDKPVNPAYYDETRKPSYCYMSTWHGTYPNPVDNGTPTQPACGWYGEVIAGRWRDIWLAQRQLAYLCPVSIIPNNRRPMVLRIEAEIDASSSDRGVESWFVVQHMPTLSQMTTPPTLHNGRIIAAWSRGNVTPVQIPPASPGAWSHTYTGTIIRDVWAGFSGDQGATYRTVRLALGSPPSRGLYFGRNAWVQVWTRLTPSFYFARNQHA